MNATSTALSLWTPCPTVFSRALVGAFGFEMFDFLGLVGLLFGGFILASCVGVPPLASFGVTGLAATVLWVGKRGKPRGAIQHWLHAWDFLPLPGILPPVAQSYHPWS